MPGGASTAVGPNGKMQFRGECGRLGRNAVKRLEQHKRKDISFGSRYVAVPSTRSTSSSTHSGVRADSSILEWYGLGGSKPTTHRCSHRCLSPPPLQTSSRHDHHCRHCRHQQDSAAADQLVVVVGVKVSALWYLETRAWFRLG